MNGVLNGNRRLLDGLMLVVVGAILLLNSLGIIPWGVWGSLGRFWPVLLILAGVSIVTHQRIPFMALLVAALVAVVAIAWAVPGALDLGGAQVYRNHTHNAQPVAPEAVGKPLTATLSFGAGDLTIRGTTDLASDLTVDHTGPAPTISSASGSDGSTLEAKSGVAGDFAVGSRVREAWTVKFNPDLPLSVVVNAGACRAQMDLTDYNLTSLSISSGASDVDVEVGTRSPAVEIAIASAASDVQLQLPPSAGVRLKSQSVINDADLAGAGLSRQGDYWESAGYETAAQKINITVSGVVGGLKVTR